MLFKGIILQCSKSLRLERTTNAIFHLITGKKSIQTLQDVHIYQLKPFYGIYKPLKKEIFDKMIKQLIQTNELETVDHDHVKLTPDGEQWLQSYANKQPSPFAHFNGAACHLTAPLFTDRLLLLIQTISNSNQGLFSYIPIIDKWDVQNWTKQLYYRIRNKQQEFLEQIYQELHTVLDTFTEDEANLFVGRLTGYKIYGKSTQQLGHECELSIMDVHLTWVRIVHALIYQANNNRDKFPVMYLILKDQMNAPAITDSARETNQLFQSGRTLAEIAKIRRLKLNTIYDHAVEIALINPLFPVNKFVSEKKQRQIFEAMIHTDTFSLKKIKNALNDDTSYFEIRLVIAHLEKWK